MTVELIRNKIVEEKPGHMSLVRFETTKDAKLGNTPPLEAKQSIAHTAKMISTPVATNSPPKNNRLYVCRKRGIVSQKTPPNRIVHESHQLSNQGINTIASVLLTRYAPAAL